MIRSNPYESVYSSFVFLLRTRERLLNQKRKPFDVFTKGLTRQEMLPFLDTLRTECFQEIMAFKPMRAVIEEMFRKAA